MRTFISFILLQLCVLAAAAHDNPERLQAIEDMQQRFARGEKGADVICLITYKYE